ncbi:hypothetical protein QTN25_002005 [Entamoeba marina]
MEEPFVHSQHQIKRVLTYFDPKLSNECDKRFSCYDVEKGQFSTPKNNFAMILLELESFPYLFIWIKVNEIKMLQDPHNALQEFVTIFGINNNLYFRPSIDLVQTNFVFQPIKIVQIIYSTSGRLGYVVKWKRSNEEYLSFEVDEFLKQNNKLQQLKNDYYKCLGCLVTKSVTDVEPINSSNEKIVNWMIASSVNIKNMKLIQQWFLNKTNTVIEMANDDYFIYLFQFIALCIENYNTNVPHLIITTKDRLNIFISCVSRIHSVLYTVIDSLTEQSYMELFRKDQTIYPHFVILTSESFVFFDKTQFDIVIVDKSIQPKNVLSHITFSKTFVFNKSQITKENNINTRNIIIDTNNQQKQIITSLLTLKTPKNISLLIEEINTIAFSPSDSLIPNHFYGSAFYFITFCINLFKTQQIVVLSRYSSLLKSLASLFNTEIIDCFTSEQNLKQQTAQFNSMNSKILLINSLNQHPFIDIQNCDIIINTSHYVGENFNQLLKWKYNIVSTKSIQLIQLFLNGTLDAYKIYQYDKINFNSPTKLLAVVDPVIEHYNKEELNSNQTSINFCKKFIQKQQMFDAPILVTKPKHDVNQFLQSFKIHQTKFENRRSVTKPKLNIQELKQQLNISLNKSLIQPPNHNLSSSIQTHTSLHEIGDSHFPKEKINTHTLPSKKQQHETLSRTTLNSTNNQQIDLDSNSTLSYTQSVSYTEDDNEIDPKLITKEYEMIHKLFSMLNIELGFNLNKKTITRFTSICLTSLLTFGSNLKHWNYKESKTMFSPFQQEQVQLFIVNKYMSENIGYETESMKTINFIDKIHSVLKKINKNNVVESPFPSHPNWSLANDLILLKNIKKYGFGRYHLYINDFLLDYILTLTFKINVFQMKKEKRDYPIKSFCKQLHFSYDVCPICLDVFVENEPVKILPCEHFFHSDCIDLWLTNHSNCPFCKSSC